MPLLILESCSLLAIKYGLASVPIPPANWLKTLSSSLVSAFLSEGTVVALSRYVFPSSVVAATTPTVAPVVTVTFAASAVVGATITVETSAFAPSST